MQDRFGGIAGRLVVDDREDDHDDGGHGGLEQRAGAGRAAGARRTAERGRQQALAAHGEGVAGDDVVEAEHRREHAGDEQDVQHVGEGAAEPGLGEVEEQARALLLGDADDLRGAGGDGERPAAEREEDGDATDGQEHHAGHQDVRAAGLLGVDRGLFEAEEGGDAEAQGGADAGAAEGVRVEGVQGQALLGRVGDGGDVEDDDERDLDDQQDAEHARVDVDLQPAERADDEDGDQRRYPPGDLEVGVGGEQVGDLEAEDAVDADLEGVVRDECHQGRARAGGAAEAAGDVRVEGARVVDVPAHLRVADAEEDQDDPQEDEEQGLPFDAHHRECGGHDTCDHHEGGGRREHGEQQAPGAETVGAQGAFLSPERADTAAVRGGAARTGTARRHGGNVLSGRYGEGVTRALLRGRSVATGAFRRHDDVTTHRARGRVRCGRR